jgi:DNA-binding NarL/FixJ family response regulator
LTIDHRSTKVDDVDEATELVSAASGTDVRAGLRAALALRRLAEHLETLQVANARQQGWSWRDIADALDVSKQAVHKKYAAREREG